MNNTMNKVELTTKNAPHAARAKNVNRIRLLFIACCFLSAVCLSDCEMLSPTNNGDDPNILVPPENPVVTAGDGQLEVAWTKIQTAQSYQLYYQRVGSSELIGPQTVEQPENNKVSGVIEPLANRVTYYVWAKAVYKSGVSEFSERAEGTPVPIPEMPASLSVSSGDAQFLANWVETDEEITAAYDIAYSTGDDADAASSVEVPYSEDGYTPLTNAIVVIPTSENPNSNTYNVWIRAKNSAGPSPWRQYSGTVSPNPSSDGTLSAPSITVSTLSKALKVTWTQNALGAYAYQLYYNTEDNFAGATAVDGTVPPQYGTISTSVPSLKNDTEYYIWAKAQNSSGDLSEPSAAQTGTPKAKAAIPWDQTGFVLAYAAQAFPDSESGHGDSLTRKKETGLADLIADSMLWWARDHADTYGGTFDFAFINGGIVKRQGIAEGNINVAKMIALTYTDDNLIIITLTGAQIKNMFYNKVAKVRHDGGGGSGTGAFGQVSAAVHYTITYPDPNTNPPPTAEQRTFDGVITALTFNGAEFEDGKTYRIVTSQALFENMDGYAAYLDVGGTSTVQYTYTGIYKAIGEYIYNQWYTSPSDTPLVPKTDGRVTLINEYWGK